MDMNDSNTKKIASAFKWAIVANVWGFAEQIFRRIHRHHNYVRRWERTWALELRKKKNKNAFEINRDNWEVEIIETN